MFSKLATVVAAGSLLFSSIVAAGDPRCDNGPWTDVHFIGKSNIDNSWCHTQQADGITITGIEGWANGDHLQALQFYYSDGSTSPQIGKPDGEEQHQRFDWDYSKETISQLKLWGDGRGKALGRIQLRTSTGNEFNVGKQTSGQDAFDIKVNSGILLGAFGGVKDSTIQGAAFLFLKSKIKTMVLDNVQSSETPEQLNEKMQGLQKMTTQFADYEIDANNTTGILIFAADEARANTKSWSFTNSHTITAGGSWAVTGKVLGIAEVTSTYKLEYSYNRLDTETNEQSSSTTFKYSINVNAKDGQHIYCRAVSMNGQYKGDWTGQLRLKLEDGSEWSYGTTGSMEQTIWGQVSAKCQEGPFPDDSVPAPPLKRAVKFFS